MYRIKTLSVWMVMFSPVFVIPQVTAAWPQAWSIWQTSNEQSSVTLDHQLWQNLLDRYVVTAEDGINRVNYGGFTGPDKANLDRYLKLMSADDPRRLSRAEQLPYWINLYNALTVATVLKYPDKNSIRRMGEKLFAIGPWDDEVIRIAGHGLTLNDIEHRILRPIWQDKRIHYAVNCASLGCPNLQGQAFTATNTETLLTQAESEYIQHPRGVNLDATNGLVLSSIFKWYLQDFADHEDGLIAYLAQHHPALKDAVDDHRELDIDYQYDWSLNAGGPTPVD